MGVISVYPAPPAVTPVRLATPMTVNTAPTLAQAISVNNNAPITGRTASLSVLGNDDGGEAKLVYTWSVTAAPAGGTATFNMNGTNAAKNATATFTKAGTYQVSVKIADTSGLYATGVKSFIVSSTLTSIGLSTSTGQAVSPSAALALAGTSQALVAQGLDQFGYAVSAPARPHLVHHDGADGHAAAGPYGQGRRGHGHVRQGRNLWTEGAGCGDRVGRRQRGDECDPDFDEHRRFAQRVQRAFRDIISSSPPRACDQFGKAMATQPTLHLERHAAERSPPRACSRPRPAAPLAP